MIGILDYGGGNIRSVENALVSLSRQNKTFEYFISDSPEELEKADKIIFPGQGRAGDVMRALEEKKMDVFLRNTKKPFLGICVGMQVLFDFLQEDAVSGLGIIPGEVIRFDSKKVNIIPHMGWNTVSSDLLEDDFYFVHSYYCLPKNSSDIFSTTVYNDQFFCSSVKRNNFTGVQFHPEKSGGVGKKFLLDFCMQS